jgi:chromosome segregation ATPase
MRKDNSNSNSNYRLRLAALWLMLAMIFSFETATAAPKTNDGSAAAVKKAQGIIRQLTQEKAALEAEKATLLTDKSAQDAKLSSLEDAVNKLLPLQAEVERYKSSLESVRSNLEEQLGQERQRQQALLQKHNEVVTKAKAINADNQLLVQAVQEREHWITQCSGRHKALHGAYLELLGKYKDKGVWQQLAELEPITGIGKVATETVVEDYRYQLKQLQITPFQAEAATEPVTGAPDAAPPPDSEAVPQ